MRMVHGSKGRGVGDRADPLVLDIAKKRTRTVPDHGLFRAEAHDRLLLAVW